MKQLHRWFLHHADARVRLLTSGFLGWLTFLVVPEMMNLSSRFLLSWTIGSLSYLLMVWILIAQSSMEHLRKLARHQDVSTRIIFALVVGATSFSVLAVGFLLRTNKSLSPSQLGLHILLSVVAVSTSWLLMHTVFTLHYAHSYYGDPGSDSQKSEAGGLLFPEESEPDYWDFAYFSFVLGMTFQVSDVQITSRALRKLALLHGILSFVFNTAIVALSVNIISSLI